MSAASAPRASSTGEPMPDFLIQKFSSSNWPAIRGEVPFVVTGPRFTAFTKTQRLEGYEWKFRASFFADLESIGKATDELSREIAAELLLREGIVDAVWADNGENAVPLVARWSASIAQVAAEIPSDQDLAIGVIELLSGLGDLAHVRSYLLDTGLDLVAVVPPAE